MDTEENHDSTNYLSNSFKPWPWVGFIKKQHLIATCRNGIIKKIQKAVLQPRIGGGPTGDTLQSAVFKIPEDSSDAHV